MSTLTPKEKAWVRKVQKVLDECPSERLGFYTIGDASITVFDKTKEKSFNEEKDLCISVDEHDAYLGELRFPSNVNSTAG